MKFHELPESVQNDVKERLRAYDSCTVTYERGSYHVSACVGITARYAPDFKICGRYAATDIFTPEERILNYANSFYGYPLEYHGKRDYRMMKSAEEHGEKLGYDNAGNICIVA